MCEETEGARLLRRTAVPLDRRVDAAEAACVLGDVLDGYRTVGRADGSDDAVHDLEVVEGDLDTSDAVRSSLSRAASDARCTALPTVYVTLTLRSRRRTGPRRCRPRRRDLLGRQAEGGGGDCGEARVHAGHVHRRRDDGHRAVGVDAADGCGRLIAAGPVADGDADAFTFGERLALRPQRVAGVASTTSTAPNVGTGSATP